MGSGDFTSAETFSMSGIATPITTDDGFAVRATPYSIWSQYAGISAKLVGNGSTSDSVDLGSAEVAGVLGFSNGGTNNNESYSAGSVLFLMG